MVAFAIQMGSRGSAARAYVTGCLGKGVVKATTLLFSIGPAAASVRSHCAAV